VESVKRALSWPVTSAGGLAPMLVYWLAGVIRRAIRRKNSAPACWERADPKPLGTARPILTRPLTEI
jgi:hypothetical protein